MPATIGGLPQARLPLTGSEEIELEQDGRSVRATTDQVSGVISDESFIVVSLSGSLANERQLLVEAGVLSLVDLGPGSTITVGVEAGGLQNAKLADMADATVKGRALGAGSGAPTDLTGAQLSAIIGGSSPSFTDLILTESNIPDLVDTDVALNIGAANPNAAQHLEFGPAQIQSKSNNTTASALTINNLGGNLQLGAPSSANIFIDSDGEIAIDRVGGLQKLQTISQGIEVFGSLSNGVGGNQDARLVLNNAADIDIALLGFIGDTFLRIRNENNGGSLAIEANDTGGTLRTILQGDPDALTILRADTDLQLQVGAGETALLARANAEVELYHNNVAKAETSVNGWDVLGTVLQVINPAATNTVVLTRNSVGGAQLRVLSTGNAIIDQTDSGGVIEDTWMFLTRNGSVDLRNNSIAVARTLPVASGGFEIANGVTGDGSFGRALNVADLPLSATAASNQDVTNSTVLVNDTALVINSVPVGFYQLNCVVQWVQVGSGPSQGFTYDFDFSGTLTGDQKISLFSTAGSTVSDPQLNTTSLGTDVSSPDVGTSVEDQVLIITGYIEVSVSGNLQFRFAQTNANAQSTRRLADSFIRLSRV